ncbi:MAG: hypothetical protein JJU11_08125 [Candidatus Sumerlaeia bacterium]|nr:hypothetical protein [Candidatus Sumerlaeia bacterium]
MRGKRNRLFLGLFLATTVFGLTTGCSRLVVESQPEGATILWSVDGAEPFRPWPPNSWEWRTTAGTRIAQESAGETATTSSQMPATPLDATGVFGDTVFITVEKDGYRRPLPKAVQLYSWRNERVSFELEELPERIAERMRAEGFLLFRGEWVDPEVAGVEEFNGVVMRKDQAYRLRQLAAGLVEYEGEWMSPEDAEAAEERDMLAAGMVRLKGRWVTEEVYEMETSIDEKVASIREEKIYADLSPPRIMERTNLSASEVQLTNSTGQQVEFLFSGPISRSFLLLPYQSAGFSAADRIALPAGNYDVVAVPTGLDARGRNLREVLGSSANLDAVMLRTEPAWAEWPLASGTKYSFNFGGSEEELREGLETFEMPVPEMRIQPPQLDIPESRAPQRPQRGQGQRPPGGGPPQGGQTQ